MTFSTGLRWKRLEQFALFSLMLLLSMTQGNLADEMEAFDQYSSSFTMAWSAQPTTLDPHPSEVLYANYTLIEHMFEALYGLGLDGNQTPLLAEKHELQDPLNWLITLKKNIRFHDGSLLTSADVVASYNRINRQRSRNTNYLKNNKIQSYQAINKHQVLITTTIPHPDLLTFLTHIPIISKQYENATSANFDSGKALIGTGPYQLVRHNNLNEFEFRAFPQYHGRKPYLQKVTAKVILNKTERIKGFEQGIYDLVDNITPADMEALSQNKRARFSMPTGVKLYHISLDVKHEQSPNVRSNTGEPLSTNPLKDRNIREAISKAIDRQAIVDELFARTGAIATSQLVPRNTKGYIPRLSTDTQDIAAAKALLTAAGYPNGFSLTLHDKEERRPILESIAAMLDKINIKTTVETLPPNIYFPRLLNHEYSAGFSFFNSYGSLQGILDSVIRKDGNANIGQYYNPDFEKYFQEATQTFDPDVRERLYRYAAEIAVKDYAIIPLFFINDIWMTRSDMDFSPQAAVLQTMAQYIIPRTR